MTLYDYPACIEAAADGGFGVFFPDLPGCVSGGDTVQQAAVNAAEALGLHIAGLAEDHGVIPGAIPGAISPPSAPDAPLPDWLAEVAPKLVARVLVPVALPGRSVRTNITLDAALLARLDAAAAAAGMSRSGVIAEAVRARLRATA